MLHAVASVVSYNQDAETPQQECGAAKKPLLDIAAAAGAETAIERVTWTVNARGAVLELTTAVWLGLQACCRASMLCDVCEVVVAPRSGLGPSCSGL